MPKQSLQLNKFAGGFNCYSDPRDIDDNEFALSWNACVSQEGIIKMGGALFENIRNLPHDNSNFEPGYGLFGVSVDNQITIIQGGDIIPYDIGTFRSYEESGVASAELASTSPYIAASLYDDNDHFNNKSLLISNIDGELGSGSGQVRRITDYTGSSKVVDLESAFGTNPDSDSSYMIFNWINDGAYFGNQNHIDYIDKAGASSYSGDDEDNYNQDNETGLFFRSKSLDAQANNQSMDLGFITYNPDKDATFKHSDTDALSFGNLSLQPGVEYTLSFYAKCVNRYQGLIANGAQGAATGGLQVFNTGIITNETVSATTSSDTLNVDTVDARLWPSLVGHRIFTSAGVELGTCSSVTNSGQTLGFSGGVNSAIANDIALYIMPKGIGTTGILVDEGTNSATTSSVTVTTDTTNATNALVKGKKIYYADGTFIGVCTSVTDINTIVFEHGIHVDLLDNTVLFVDGEAERIPFVQLYSNTAGVLTNTTTATSLVLQQGDGHTEFIRGDIYEGTNDATEYRYFDNITTNFINNGDFESGSSNAGYDHNAASTGTRPPTGWKAYDTPMYLPNWGENVGTVAVPLPSSNILQKYIYTQGAGGNGNSLFIYGNSLCGGPAYRNNFIYQEVFVDDNCWYELNFLMGQGSQVLIDDGIFTGIDFAIFDCSSLEELKVNDKTVTVNNGSGIAAADSGTIQCSFGSDDDETSQHIDHKTLGKMIFDGDGNFIGIPTKTCHTGDSASNTGMHTLQFEGGINTALSDNDVLYTAKNITPWGSESTMLNTDNETSYRMLGQNSDGDIPKPYKFFVSGNTELTDLDGTGATRVHPLSIKGSGRKLMIAFALANTDFFATSYGTIKLDGITLRKSYPDLLSMNPSLTQGGAYLGGELTWMKYQTSFTVPSDSNTVSDWILNLHAGRWGRQDGSTYDSDNQTVYLGGIKLESKNRKDDLLFLNDNTSKDSRINIYSYNMNNWIENEIVFDNPNAKPVYDYINGMVKISDANFESGNTSKLFYWNDTSKLNGNVITKGWYTRNFPLSKPPSLEAFEGNEQSEINESFNALYYINKYTFGKSGDGYTTQEFDGKDTGWPLGDIGGGSAGGSEITDSSGNNISQDTGRVMFYQTDDKESGDSHSFCMLRHPGTTGALHDNQLGVKGGFDETFEKRRSFYLAWAGDKNHGMKKEMEDYTTGSVKRIEFTFEYDFAAAYKGTDSDSGNSSWKKSSHPYFEIEIGKYGESNTNIFTDDYVSVSNQRKLSENEFTSIENKISVTNTDATLRFGNSSNQWGDDGYGDKGGKWSSSNLWPSSTVSETGAGGQDHNVIYDRQKFKGTWTFPKSEDDGIPIDQGVLMKVRMRYPNGDSTTDLQKCVEYKCNDRDNKWDFARKERIIFKNIDVYFHNDDFEVGAMDSAIARTLFNFDSPSSNSSSEVFGWEGRIFKVGVSSVNIYGEESNLEIAGGLEIGAGTSAAVDNHESNITSGKCPTVDIYVGKEVAEDIYRNKLKFYMKDITSDIWYLQFYVDLKDNRAYSTTSSGFAEGQDFEGTSYGYCLKREHMLSYNEIDSYESETSLVSNNHANKSIQELICQYKTSTVANNRLYVGNIKQNGTSYEDRMIKSPVNKYNILPSSNFIDVANNDGDEITALASFKDKLLQFKKNKVYIINISGDYEFIEETYEQAGVSLPCNVVKTPYGIAWINSNGCYLYDGSRAINLIDNKIPSSEDEKLESGANWPISMGTNKDYNIGNIGYNFNTKDLVIARHIKKGGPTINFLDGAVYNIPTKSWYFTHRSFQGLTAETSSGDMSNFITDKDGNLISYVKKTTTSGGAGTGLDINDILQWQPSEGNDEDLAAQRGLTTSSKLNQRNYYFTTKDFTFGDIAKRKKIYKVYITYTSKDSGGSSANSKVLCKFSVNGVNSFSAFSDDSTNYAASTGFTGSTTWATAILTPSSAINNIYSFQLQFLALGYGDNKPAVDFRINDITIIYREKSLK